MINSIEINNFKGIKALQLDNLSRLTVIGGKNNCKKTTILEALFLLLTKKDPTIFNRLLSWRGINGIPLEAEFIYAPFFHNFNLRNNIKIIINKNKKDNLNLSISVDSKYKKTFSINNFPINNANQNNLHTILTEAVKFQYSSGINTILESYLSINDNGFDFEIKKDLYSNKFLGTFVAARQFNNYLEDVTKLNRLEIKGLSNNVVEVLKIIVPNLNSLRGITLGQSAMIYAGIDGKIEQVPISSMGDGIARLLSIILSIANSENGIVFIDEIENGLHYSVLENVWTSLSKASEKFNCQIIATTHSHEFLTYVSKSNAENLITDFSYIRLNNRNDEIEGKNFDSELFSYAIENDMEIR